MDIKEIAQRLAPGYWKRDQWNIEYFDSVEFAEALISAYKAELLKEAGEPFGFYYEINGTWDAFVVGETEPDDDVYDEGSLKALFTSGQVAAAVLKATKPLEDQLAAAQEEINSPPAIDAYEMYMADDEESNPVERLKFFLSLALKGQDWIDVEKFIDDVSNHIAKAEQRVAEWQPIETAPKDGQSYLAYSTEFVNQYWVTDKCNGMTHWMPLPKAPANGGNS